MALTSRCTTVLKISAVCFYQNVFKTMKSRYIWSNVSKPLTDSIGQNIIYFFRLLKLCIVICTYLNGNTQAYRNVGPLSVLLLRIFVRTPAPTSSSACFRSFYSLKKTSCLSYAEWLKGYKGTFSYLFSHVLYYFIEQKSNHVCTYIVLK